MLEFYRTGILSIGLNSGGVTLVLIGCRADQRQMGGLLIFFFSQFTNYSLSELILAKFRLSEIDFSRFSGLGTWKCSPRFAQSCSEAPQ